MTLLTRLCVLWFALMAGFFFAYDSTVMPGLDTLPPAIAMQAMQQINAVVKNAWFAVGFWGAIVLALGGLGAAIARGARRHRWLIAGSLVYISGAFAVTLFGNVPLNESLAVLDAASPDADTLWAHYAEPWNRLNLVRTMASFLAAALVLFGTPSGREG